MVRLIRSLMSKFVKSRLLVDKIDGKKVPKSITDLLLVNVTIIKNCKPIKVVDVGTEAKSCFPGSLEISKEEKEFRQSCLKCYQVFGVNKQYWSLIQTKSIICLVASVLFKQILDLFVILYTITSLIHLMRAIACVHATTRATSLMYVKIAHATFVYDTCCVGHSNEGNDKIKHQIE